MAPPKATAEPPKPKPGKVGRPSDYGQQIADTICERIADGQSLREICRGEGMPDQRTIYRWLEAQEEFRQQYARAREAQADRFADEVLEISDDASNDWMIRRAENGQDVPVIDHEHIARSRLRVDSRKWLMSKMAPKKYGDKITHAGDADNPVVLRHEDRLALLK